MNTLIVRHETEPVNAKTSGTYEPFDNIDFTLDFNQRAILMNSIKISGRVAVRKGGNKLTGAEQVLYDPTIGAHNFIDTITSGTERQGNLETIQQYSRYSIEQTKTSNTTRLERRSSRLSTTGADEVNSKGGTPGCTVSTALSSANTSSVESWGDTN